MFIPRTEYCFSFQGHENIDNSLKLLNKHNDIFFFLHNFGVQFIPFELGKSKKKLYENGVILAHHVS